MENNEKEIQKLLEEVTNYFKAKNYNKIIEICDKIIELNPKDEKAYCNKENALLQFWQYEEE